MAAPLPNSTAELFTPANITAVGIATAAVMAVTNTFKVMFNVPPKRTAFGASLVIAYLVVAMKPMPPWYEWILAFFNACLLFLSALGLNETASGPSTQPRVRGMAGPRRFFESWTHR